MQELCQKYEATINTVSRVQHGIIAYATTCRQSFIKVGI